MVEHVGFFPLHRRKVARTVREYPEISSVLRHRTWATRLLIQLDTYHSPTFLHSIQVGRVVSALGERMVAKGRISATEQRELTLAGLLHDFGKAALGERGLRMLQSTEITSPDHPDRLFARQHVRKGVEAIKAHAKFFGIIPDQIGLQAAYIVAGHHEQQNNRYPRLQDDTDNSMPTRRIVRKNIQEMQRLLAACDQAVGIAMAAQGGHAFVQENLPLSAIKQKLVYGRDGAGPARFEDIADDILEILVEKKIVSV